MFKSLILSALLSFGTASYEFDCSDILQARSFIAENSNYNLKRSYTPGQNEYHFTMSFTDLNPSSSDLNLQVDLTDLVLPDFNTTYSLIGGNTSDNFFYYSDYSDTDSCYFDGVRKLTDKYIIDIYTLPGDAIPSFYVSFTGVVSLSAGSYNATNYVVSSTNINASRLLGRIFEEYITDINFDLVEPVPALSLIEEIGQVLMWVPGQFVTLFSTLTAVFYADGALTLPGLFLVIGLGVFICALILDFILKFRRI